MTPMEWLLVGIVIGLAGGAIFSVDCYHAGKAAGWRESETKETTEGE
jgi:hypothetical protein